jgi:3-oxoacyl-[acyl-carrier protein] reductase
MRAGLAHQVALITGAGRGIGRATALRLAAMECDVVLVARTAAEIDAVAASATAHGVRALAHVADITNDAQLESLIEKVRAQLGRISILVNNACLAPPRTRVAKMQLADLDETLATGLRAPMVLSRLLLPDMLAQRQGAIINVASAAPYRVRPGEAGYAAAKAGLIAFSRALFAEVRASGIKVATICPGYVDTTFVPQNRRVDRSKFLQAEDIAEMIIHILTTAAHLCPTQIVVEPQFDPERC